jgi:hypothetical protein
VYIDTSDVTVKNCILWGNYGCEIWIDTTASSLTVTYSDVDTTSGEGYCGIDDQTGSNGNIYAWPAFRDTVLETANYRFQDSTSACIDAGDPDDTDLPWWGCDRIDMGAIQFPLEYYPGDVQFDWLINQADVDYLNEYCYCNGPSCYPPPSGDVNCDGVVNVGDIIYLSAYLSGSGPPPEDSCHYKCDGKSEQGPNTEELVAKLEGANLPRTFSLSQNHPNPFNPDTRISYALPRGCYVTLTVYNVLGQKVVTLVDEPELAGWHEVIWAGKDDKGSDLASGIYFYRLSADDFTQSKKMLLLK